MRKLLLGPLALAAVLAAILAGNAGAGGEKSVGPKLDLMSALPTVAPDLQTIIAQSGASSTGSGKSPRVGPNVQVNAPQAAFPAGLLGRSETTITALAGGQDVVAGWNDAQGFCGAPFGAACTPQTPTGLSGYGFSTDGGLTWTDGGAPNLFNNVFTRGDPWLADDGADTIFYANLSVDATTGADLGVSVHRGSFSGSTFGWNDVHVFNSPNAANSCVNPAPPPPATIACDFYDKEAIVAGKGRNMGDAYVSLTNFRGQNVIQPGGCGSGFGQFGFGQIEVWRTHNGGNSWLGPAIAGPEASDSVATCGNLGTLQQSSAPAIGPNGEVYVVWQFGPTFTPATGTSAQIRFARSLDGGASFDPEVTVASINSMRQNPPVGYNRDRINDHPRIAVATHGENKGRIYVVYYSAEAPVTAPPTVPGSSCLVPPVAPASFRCRAQTLTSSNVFLKYSDNQGATWSAPIAVAGTVPATGLKRWWPDVNVGEGGDVQITYYESQETQATANPSDVECNVNVGGGIRRQGLNSSLVDTWWTQSTDGGATWSMPLKLSDTTSNWCTAVSNVRPNFGDYMDSDAVSGHRIYALWADGRNGVPDAFFAAGKGVGNVK
jgi:hypothetical protein